MTNINQWIGEGNISSDPQIRLTNQNKSPVTNFYLYVDSTYKNKNINNQTDPKYIKTTCKVPIVAWAGKAEYICKNFRKGDKVRLMGHIRTKEIQFNEKKIITFEIVAKNVSLITKNNAD